MAQSFPSLSCLLGAYSDLTKTQGHSLEHHCRGVRTYLDMVG